MHQDPHTGVLIPDLDDIVSPPGPTGFPETDWWAEDVVDPADVWADDPATEEIPVPPPVRPSWPRAWTAFGTAVVAGIAVIALLETITSGLTVVLAVAAGLAVAEHMSRRRRAAAAPPPPDPGGDPTMIDNFRAGQPLDVDGVREYELRVYDGTFRVLRGERLTVRVDLADPDADGVLARHRRRHAEEARLRNHALMQRPRLAIHDARTGVRIKYWTGA